MSWRSFAFICTFVTGLALFLYGSNYYDAVVGWIGVFLVVGDICAIVILRVHGFMAKRRDRSRTGTV